MDFVLKMDKISDKILHQGGIVKKDLQTELVEYLRNLDRLHWEYLRESEKYKTDWQAFITAKQDYPDIQKKIEGSIPVIIGSTINTFFINLENDYLTNQSTLWMQYGIQALCNPALSYDDVFEICQKELPELKYLFYDNHNEYIIHEGVFKKLNYEESPFITLTVNTSFKIDLLTKVFRELISTRKTQLIGGHLSALPSRKWILPKNVHFEPLAEALAMYRLHIHDSMSYTDIAHEWERRTGKDYFSQHSIVKKNIPKAKRTIKHVEKGMFP